MYSFLKTSSLSCSLPFQYIYTPLLLCPDPHRSCLILKSNQNSHTGVIKTELTKSQSSTTVPMPVSRVIFLAGVWSKTWHSERQPVGKELSVASLTSAAGQEEVNTWALQKVIRKGDCLLLKAHTWVNISMIYYIVLFFSTLWLHLSHMQPGINSELRLQCMRQLQLRCMRQLQHCWIL